MKKYIKTDINSYSHTSGGFGDERIVLARYNAKASNEYSEGDTVTLVKDGFNCYVEIEDPRGDLVYNEFYLMKDIKSAIADFNEQARAKGNWRTLTLNDVKFHLSEGYGISLDDYLPGGFYDEIRKPR